MAVVVDRHFSDPALAELYDAFCAGCGTRPDPNGRADFRFYLPIVMQARSVLDVGCGTGELLRLAREGGHTGRLSGLDPAAAMLDVARRRADIEWVLGDPTSVHWSRSFDLAVMTGHAFQVLVEDEDILASLRSIRDTLSDDGRFIFETRNPLAREWERWPDHPPTEVEHNGISVRASGPPPVMTGDRLSFSSVYTSPSWPEPRVSHSTLRFLDAPSLASFLTRAGLPIDEQFGDFDCSPLTEASPQIITVARRA